MSELRDLTEEEVELIEEALETHVFHYTSTHWQTGEPREYTNEGWYAWEEAEGTGFHEVENLGQVKVVENFGGEGEGDQYYITFEVVMLNGDTRYFRMNGYHVSHDGSYYDGPFVEVKKTTRLTDFYE